MPSDITLNLECFRHGVQRSGESMLAERSHLANEDGRRIDLSGCYYEPHRSEPEEYYHYLAGLVRVFRAIRVLEIGTQFGGSIKSMIRGVPTDRIKEAKFVTVDITDLNREGFMSFPDNLLKRVRGDAAEPSTVDKVGALFGDEPIDLLFIDSDHNYRSTGQQINLYANRLQPRLLVLDDIRLNHSMRELWTDLVSLMGDRCFDASQLVRRGVAGFGAILLRDP